MDLCNERQRPLVDAALLDDAIAKARNDPQALRSIPSSFFTCAHVIYTIAKVFLMVARSLRNIALLFCTSANVSIIIATVFCTHTNVLFTVATVCFTRQAST